MTGRQLPESFSELEPLVADWALPTRAQRYAARLRTPYDDLVAFYDAVAPRAEAAIAHLDEQDINALPEDTRLMHLLYLDDPGLVRGQRVQAKPHPRFGRGVLRYGRRTGGVI